ncbi:MAG TPA: mercury resistance system periplasmic binding protein MerP [Gammaproteobacteria bacterium]|nr:mercury resistance system periplasmic binding protein MerP [Gammaproteobacteria bacterium]
MFRKIAFLLLSLSLCAGLLPGTATRASEEPALETVTLAVDNMTCRMCPITVRKSLTRIDGVHKATVDFDNKTATVEFDPRKTRVDDLIAATSNAGYPSHLKQ